MKKTALIIFFALILFLESAYGLSIGVSPEEMRFDKSNVERQVILFNPNDVAVEFNISIEDDEERFFLIRKGEIDANDLVKLRIRYNSTYFNDLETKMDIKYSVKDSGDNIGIMPAASVKIIVYGEENVLLMKEKNEQKSAETSSKDNIKNISTIIAIIIVIAIFIYLMAR